MKSIKSVFIMFAALVLMGFLGLTGCASFDKNFDTEKIIVQVATMKVIEVGETSIERHIRADSILAVTSEARSWMNRGSVDLGDLRTTLDDRVGQLALSPSDRILADMLINQVVVSLNERIVDGVKLPVPPEEFKYQVNTVLGWIEGAAQLY